MRLRTALRHVVLPALLVLAVVPWALPGRAQPAGPFAALIDRLS